MRACSSGGSVAMSVAAVDAAASPKKTYAVHVDHLNRPIMLTDAAKTNVWWASYEPFGRVRATGGTLTQNLGLPGQWFQLETGLSYNWHRHYDATTGRYTTADPLGFVDGPSLFAYAGNNPQRMVDPNGLQGAGGPGKNFTPRPDPNVQNCFNPGQGGGGGGGGGKRPSPYICPIIPGSSIDGII
jgi:RHS repeat-associated protein